MKHIVICGRRGVGKSTLIRRLLDENRRPVRGFVTRKEPMNEEGLCGVHIYPAANDFRIAKDENRVGFCLGRILSVNADVFDLLGSAYLEADNGEIIVMDELGIMETHAERFQRAVMRALDGEIPIIAAVKARCDAEFLNAVRDHPNARVYEITEENREELYEALLPVIREWNRM